MKITTYNKLLILIGVILLSSCKSNYNFPSGGGIKTDKTIVSQPEDAEDSATLDEIIKNIDYEYKAGDVIEIEENGKVKIIPNSTGTLKNHYSNTQADTGKSYKNNVKEISAIIGGYKPVQYVALFLLIAAPIVFYILKDLKISLIFAGTGVGLLLLSAMLPAVYSNFAWIMCLFLLIVPVALYFYVEKQERLNTANKKAYDYLKAKNQKLAEEFKLKFYSNINANDTK